MTSISEDIIREAVSKYGTPCYVSEWASVASALEELKILEGILPIRHWLSLKTHPLAPLLRRWRLLGFGVEVVSEYEFLAALNEHVPPELILVNGAAKHSWLSNCDVKGIRVHFDSLQEVEELASRVVSCRWRVGIRCHVSEEYDPDEPNFGGQFGMLPSETAIAVAKLKQLNANLESVHFHLRTNVESPDCYRRAISEISGICQFANFAPTYVDCGGGLPVHGEQLPDPNHKTGAFDMSKFRDALATIPHEFPGASEIWLENGRFITARSCALVVSVLDIKERADSRYIICDGGRTNHALVSDWESHQVLTIPRRTGSLRLSTICGPTCMAFDRLIRTNVPEDIQVGDSIVWVNAGAYHIPWETRFSHGLAKVIWCDEGGKITVARNSESFAQWWGQWA